MSYNHEVDVEEITRVARVLEADTGPELHDYHGLLRSVPLVYLDITDGRISKPHTTPEAVIAEAHDCTERHIQEAHGLRPVTEETQNGETR